MPPSKSLQLHVLDWTFRARRHRDLLDGPLVRWPELAAIQAEYQATEHELDRRALAVQFERAVRALALDVSPGDTDEMADTAIVRRRLTAPERWYASMGPGFGDWTSPDVLGFRRPSGPIDWQGFDKLRRRWDHWDRRHGRYWRAARGIDHQLDREKLAYTVTGKRPNRIDDVEATIAAHTSEVAAIVAAKQPIPEPPRLDLVRGAPGGARAGHRRQFRHV